MPLPRYQTPMVQASHATHCRLKSYSRRNGKKLYEICESLLAGGIARLEAAEARRKPRADK